MEAEDVLDLPASSNSDFQLQNNGLESGDGSTEANPLVGNEDNMKRNLDMEKDLDLMEDNLRPMGGQYPGETLAEKVSDVVNASIESVAADEKVGIQKQTLIHTALNVSSKSGVKRPRTMSDEQQPTVHVTYKHLTRASKQKLERLLQQWSEWEAEYTSSAQDEEQPLESGEETYFPALHVGMQKTSSVSFWIDNQTDRKPLDEFVLVESSTTPLYDRKFAIGLNSADGSNNLEGGLEIIEDPPRCFNCGGYSHSLRECPKPFDRLAVNSARKQHKSKRNQTTGSRLPSRYYQKPQSGKYDGLKPGTLDVETRQLLNLGELDPPPWLNRMREIGYPPGYLAPEDDHLSGITIFGEEVEIGGEIESEDGEILEKAKPGEAKMKKTVEFPGINGPLPENADEWLWEAGPSSRSSIRWQQRTSRGHDHRRTAQAQAQPQPRDYRDEGVESSSYPPRYSSRYDNSCRSRSPGIERSLSERSKRDYSSYDPDFRDGDRDRDRNRDSDRDRDREWDRDWDRNRDRDRDWERDRDWDRDRDRDMGDCNWSYRFTSRK